MSFKRIDQRDVVWDDPSSAFLDSKNARTLFISLTAAIAEAMLANWQTPAGILDGRVYFGGSFL